MENLKKYPIKVVSQVTGLSLHVIRAWEKRYNAVEPIRTETNRRLYTEDDIEKLKLLVQLTGSGHNIGSIAGLSINELKELSGGFERSSKLEFNNKLKDTDPEFYLNKCLEAVYNFKSRDLEANLMSAAVMMSQPMLFEKVILPLSVLIGEKWKSGEVRVYQEHMYSAVVKSYLLGLIDSNTSSEFSPSILVSTPQNQVHEIGALIAAAYASSGGWNVSYLGPNLPAEEIIAAALNLKAKAIALSIVYPEDQMAMRRDLKKLGDYLPSDMKLIVGGYGAQFYTDVLKEINAVQVDDFEDYRNILSELRVKIVTENPD